MSYDFKNINTTKSLDYNSILVSNHFNPPTSPNTPEKIQLQSSIIDNLLITEENIIVDTLASQIDITNPTFILQYVADSQNKITAFFEVILNKINTIELDEVTNIIASLVDELKYFTNKIKPTSLLDMFKVNGNNLFAIETKNNFDEGALTKITNALENHQGQLVTDISMLDDMYTIIQGYLKELSIYILAGKKKLEQVRTTELPKLKEQAQLSKLPEDSQEANALASFCNDFEKELYHLELVKIISIKISQQIKLIQNNDTAIVEKFHSTLVNTIPLWNSHISIALGITHLQQAMAAQSEITNMTNEFLKNNGKTLEITTIDTDKDSENSIVETETLQVTNHTFISTLDEVVQLLAESCDNRRVAKAEIEKIKGELNNNILNISLS